MRRKNSGDFLKRGGAEILYVRKPSYGAKAVLPAQENRLARMHTQGTYIEFAGAGKVWCAATMCHPRMDATHVKAITRLGVQVKALEHNQASGVENVGPPKARRPNRLSSDAVGV